MTLQADFALTSGAFLYLKKSVLRDFALISGLPLHPVPLQADSTVIHSAIFCSTYKLLVVKVTKSEKIRLDISETNQIRLISFNILKPSI